MLRLSLVSAAAGPCRVGQAARRAGQPDRGGANGKAPGPPSPAQVSPGHREHPVRSLAGLAVS